MRKSLVREPRPRPPADARRDLDFAIEELESRRDMLQEMAPATDDCARMLRRVSALEHAIAILRQPQFEVSPFV